MIRVRMMIGGQRPRAMNMTDLRIVNDLVEGLTRALASYEDQPGVELPEWVRIGEDALADALVGPDAGLITRLAAVDAAISEVLS